jgi:hypothetical protein
VTDNELWDALAGLHEYDRGCVSCGVHDEQLLRRVGEELSAELKPNQLFPDRLTRLLRDRLLSEEMIGKGFGLEDVVDFAGWFEDRVWSQVTAWPA